VSAGATGAGVRIGVLALQGDVAEHRSMLEALGVEVRELRLPADLAGIEAVVLPGGESTTLGMLLDSSGLRAPLSALLDDGLPAFGTCAGMILLSREVLDGRPDQEPLGAIDIAVRRNAFGRQLDSFEADLEVGGLEGPPVHAVFIRAPVVESVGPDVEVLAAIDLRGERRPVVCRAGDVIVASFHPELDGESRLHQLLIEAALRRRVAEVAPPRG
jgi:pyridoxal 5'-phosphate synthase pdxT subunit